MASLSTPLIKPFSEDFPAPFLDNISLTPSEMEIKKFSTKTRRVVFFALSLLLIIGLGSAITLIASKGGHLKLRQIQVLLISSSVVAITAGGAGVGHLLMLWYKIKKNGLESSLD